ncbi:MAG: phosphatidylglycerol lysyltransferase domain-containing protein [Lactobacillales bacterium]|jgi:hypothetical protein|nr:phosphatidylglycerol lysyltransferase domain-containing protein [Lactobacillales bacterium]
MNVENSLNLRSLTLEDEDWFYRLTCHIGMSDFSFPLLCAYRKRLDVKYVRLNERTALIMQNNAYGKRCITIIGEINRAVIKEVMALGIMEFSYVSKKQLPLFISIEGTKWDITCDRDFSDYIYNLDEFLHPSKKARKQYNHFKKHHHTKLVEMTRENWEDSYHVYQSWTKTHSDLSVFGDQMEIYRQMREVIGHPGIMGVILYEEEIPISFRLVEKKEVMVISHFAINRVPIRGMTRVVAHDFFSQFQNKVEWINLSEDIGNLGLRQFKKQLHPRFLLHKYTLRLRAYKEDDLKNEN